MSGFSKPPREVVYLASVRSAKTITADAAVFRMTQTVDVSRLGPGEVPRVSLVSLSLDKSKNAFGMLAGALLEDPELSKLVIGDPTADSLLVRHPTGRPIEIKCVAGARAGNTLVANWSAGVVFDEAARMVGSEDGVVNLDDARKAILSRLLPGAQALYVSSPWAPNGPVYDFVEEHWGKPKPNMVVLRGTGPMLNPVWWTPERCEELLATDPGAYQTDVMGEFADPESGLLSPVALKASTRPATQLELEPHPHGVYAAALDPSEGSAGGNGWALAIVQVLFSADAEGRTVARYRNVLTREWRGETPNECLRRAAVECARFGLTRARTDQYAAASNADLARQHGLVLDIEKTTATTKVEDWTNFATLLHSGALEIAPDPQLRNDLLGVKRKTTQNGITIVLQRTADGRHCDKASALCAAVAELVAHGGQRAQQPDLNESRWDDSGEQSRSWGFA